MSRIWHFQEFLNGSDTRAGECLESERVFDSEFPTNHRLTGRHCPVYVASAEASCYLLGLEIPGHGQPGPAKPNPTMS